MRTTSNLMIQLNHKYYDMGGRAMNKNGTYSVYNTDEIDISANGATFTLPSTAKRKKICEVQAA